MADPITLTAFDVLGIRGTDPPYTVNFPPGATTLQSNTERPRSDRDPTGVRNTGQTRLEVTLAAASGPPQENFWDAETETAASSIAMILEPGETALFVWLDDLSAWVPYLYDKYVPQAPAVQFFAYAAYGGMFIDSQDNIGSLGPDWQHIAPFDQLSVATPRGISFDLVNGRLSFDIEGVYVLAISGAIEHNSSNQGRSTYLRVYNFTTSQATGLQVIIGTGRNAEASTIVSTILFEVTAADVGDQFQVELGGGDVYSLVFLNALDISAWSVGEFRGEFQVPEPAENWAIFNGSTSRVEIPEFTFNNLWAVEWEMLSNVNQLTSVMTRLNTVVNSRIWHQTDQSVRLQQNGLNRDVAAGVDITAAHKYRLVRNGTTLELYVDDSPTPTDTTTIVTTAANWAWNLLFSRWGHTTGVNDLDGFARNVKIWDATGTLWAWYKLEADAQDYSGNNRHGTATDVTYGPLP